MNFPSAVCTVSVALLKLASKAATQMALKIKKKNKKIFFADNFFLFFKYKKSTAIHQLIIIIFAYFE